MVNRDELIAEIEGQAKWSLEIDHEPKTLEFSRALLQLVEEFKAQSLKLQHVSKLLDDWAEAEKQGLGVPILAGIGQIQEALK